MENVDINPRNAVGVAGLFKSLLSLLPLFNFHILRSCGFEVLHARDWVACN